MSNQYQEACEWNAACKKKLENHLAQTRGKDHTPPPSSIEDNIQFLRGHCTKCGSFESQFDASMFPDNETTDKAQGCVGGKAVYLFDGGKGPLEDGACCKCGSAYATRKTDEKGRFFYVIKHDEKMAKKEAEKEAKKKEAEKKKAEKKKANNLERGRDDEANEAPVKKRYNEDPDPVYELLRTYTKLEEDIEKNGQTCCGSIKGGSQRCGSRLQFVPNKWVAGSFFCGKHQKQSPEVLPRCSEQHCGLPLDCELCQKYLDYMADGAGPRSM